MKKIKIILFTILSYFFIIGNAFSIYDKNNIIPVEDSNGAIKNTEFFSETTPYYLDYIKDSIFSLLALIAIAVFIFIGAKLIMARWNPEEFKKVIMNFIYAVIWLAIVALSWGAVKLISSLDF